MVCSIRYSFRRPGLGWAPTGLGLGSVWARLGLGLGRPWARFFKKAKELKALCSMAPIKQKLIRKKQKNKSTKKIT